MQKTVTIKTIANEIGMSISGVSKALNDYPDINEETKKAVIMKAIELGYTPNLTARNLAKSISNTIGIIVKDTDTTYGELFKDLSRVAESSGLNLLIADSDRSKDIEVKHVKSMMESRVKGIIIVPVSSDITEIKKVVKFRVPIIFLGGWVTSDKENVVAQDNAYGTNLAMDYLLGLGHRKIAYITDRIRSNTNQTKLSGYRTRMVQAGLEPKAFVDEEANLIAAGARQAALMLDTGEKFTAILASKDLVAIGAMNEIRSRGLRIPEDISVVGFGGSEASSLPMIDLTTIAQPKKDLAENLIRIMVSLAEYGHDAPPQHYFAKPTLIERKSCRHI